MPHLITQYSNNIKHINIKSLLSKMNQALFSTGLFSTSQEIKSRGWSNCNVVIGLDEPQEAYIHVILYILSGRDAHQKSVLSQTLLQILEQEITSSNGLSI
ncbi:5-carboxymethyl-2-hydroxymuconate Delta-isomerase [Acinetobacter rathckeae]|uniref:5-carboxymethyl-2-hydroxymuconate Delta-isomerase n=1 Tax=Acinetobacter rathckeae TaxID=2605272 RepID=UPI0018A2851C|nr:5-carboxymethyl-2-hydroxymuconate isomerase [Acinetobacter rathckeae]MBF7687350.1 5-carboxymethyl-2-hydroxymuconate isomerase [Acinetobacter rathckeae]MBF7694751.1 5-carboxymethyl-2-hydroxymuconate isomerase [Acinetobacter rathckeae]